MSNSGTPASAAEKRWNDNWWKRAKKEKAHALPVIHNKRKTTKDKE